MSVHLLEWEIQQLKEEIASKEKRISEIQASCKHDYENIGGLSEYTYGQCKICKHLEWW